MRAQTIRPAVIGVEVTLGAVAGVVLGVAMTALRWVLVRRFAVPTSVPPSPDVLETERTRQTHSPLTDRRTR